MTRREQGIQHSHDSDWKELFEVMKIAIIVIEKDELIIKRYNRSASDIFNNLTLEKPISTVTYEFIYDDLVSDLEQLFKELTPVRNLVSTKKGNWYLVAIEILNTSRDNIDYAILSMVDVTDLKAELEEKIETEKQLQVQILNVEEKERWRLGQYLHDNTAQNLIGIKMLLDNIDPQLQQLDKETKGELKKIKRLVIKTEKNIRELSHFVLPIEIEGKSSMAFQKLINQTKDLYDIRCNLKADEFIDDIKDPAFVSSLYYITQEAIRNAIHHGQADGIEIDLTVDKECLYLNVKENRIGYVESTKGNGKGTNIMRHRAKLLGGALEIAESKDGGTTVQCVVPLERVIKDK